ncbi:MAG: hypothetical protein QM796_07810 [Chthoniobacteraceae bacterium]
MIPSINGQLPGQDQDKPERILKGQDSGGLLHALAGDADGVVMLVNPEGRVVQLHRCSDANSFKGELDGLLPKEDRGLVVNDTNYPVSCRPAFDLFKVSDVKGALALCSRKLGADGATLAKDVTALGRYPDRRTPGDPGRHQHPGLAALHRPPPDRRPARRLPRLVQGRRSGQGDQGAQGRQGLRRRGGGLGGPAGLPGPGRQGPAQEAGRAAEAAACSPGGQASRHLCRRAGRPDPHLRPGRALRAKDR